MTVDAFVDTNVLVYAAVGREDAPAKYARAWEIIGQGDYGISAQVLGEFFVNVIRKSAIPLSIGEASAWVEKLREVTVVPIDHDLVAGAIARCHKDGISYWDAAIVSAAERLGATILYTEDLNDGQRYGSVTAVNPFKEH